jgi:hypothetical protein
MQLARMVGYTMAVHATFSVPMNMIGKQHK